MSKKKQPKEQPASIKSDIELAYGLRKAAGVLDCLETISDAEALVSVASTLSGDLAEIVLGHIKKLRLDIGKETPPSQIIGTCERHLPVKLTDQEVTDFSRRALEMAEEADNLEAEAKAEMQAAKERFSMLRSMAKDVRSKALKKEEYRQVEVANHWDSVSQKIRMIRIDTNEEIGTRQPTPDEMQMPLFGG